MCKRFGLCQTQGLTTGLRDRAATGEHRSLRCLPRSGCCPRAAKKRRSSLKRILPQDRFSHHAAKAARPPALLASAIARFGLDPGRCRIEPLLGGFMNVNFRVTEGDEDLVFRVYSDPSSARREQRILVRLKSTAIRVPTH